MGLFKKMFKKDGEDKANHPKGFHELTVSEVKKLTDESVQISFDVPEDLKASFRFIPGQYVNILVDINGKEERRSYSICSGKDEPLSVAIKAVSGGTVSKWANAELSAGATILVSKPEGNFTLKDSDRQVVAFAAGSGITPILAIAKALENNGGKLELFYGNKSEKSILFHSTLADLKQTTTHYFLSQEEKAGFESGRLTKEAVSAQIKANLALLKADAFFLCGPEELIVHTRDLLKTFGVSADKIHYELFTTPVAMASNTTVSDAGTFKGSSKVKVILDDEEISFQLNTDGKTILDAVNDQGYDAPYSCRGAVCCTCRAKVLKGKATMTLNYSLTDQELADGFILTCQAHPATEELIVSYDE